MKIISGGQTGVDRAALDVAIERGMEWGGWCPKGGWAEDLTEPAGPSREVSTTEGNPDSNPLQRTEWNVRDSDAALIITDGQRAVGLHRHAGARIEWARQHGKPELVVDASDAKAPAHAAAWLHAQRKRFGPHMTLSIGGPRESEAPGIYVSTRALIAAMLDRVT